MDDGLFICFKVIIDEEKGLVVFDFIGIGFEVWGNLNVSIVVVYSVIIYW